MKSKAFLRNQNLVNVELRLFSCNSGRFGIENTTDDKLVCWLGKSLSDAMRGKPGKEIVDFFLEKCDVKYYEPEDGYAGWYAFESNEDGTTFRYDGN